MPPNLVKLEGDQVQLEGDNVILGEESPPALGSPGFLIYHNGDLVTFMFSPHHLSSISLGIAAYDGQIGMGQMTVPGDPGWVAGDRVTFTDLDGRILYTGYVGDWSVSRNEASDKALQVTYQLMDLNRQLIGRMLHEWTAGIAPSVVELGVAYTNSSVFIEQFITEICPDMTFDLTYLDLFGPVLMPVKAYTGDGFMDVGADLILYTGKTFFLVPSQVENVPEFHFHALAPGPITAGISVSDVPAQWSDPAIVEMSDPVRSMSASDLKNDVLGQTGTKIAIGDNAVSKAIHGAGGLMWQSILSYSVSEQDLLTLVNNILNPVTGSGEERPTYTFTIPHLRGEDLIKIPAGSYCGVVSDVIGSRSARIGHETLSVSLDVSGNPLPGYWDIAVELGYPFRLPAAIRGYGGQGGDSGALAAEFAIADHIDVVLPDLIPPVGDDVVVPGYMRSEFGAIVNNGDVEVFWTLEQWQDEAGTVPSTAWSLSDDSTLTDRFGVALVTLQHDTADPWSWYQVHASL